MTISPQAVLVATTAFAMFVFFSSSLAHLLRGSDWMPQALRSIVGKPQSVSGLSRAIAYVWVWFWVILTQAVVLSLALGSSTLLGKYDQFLYVVELIVAAAYSSWLARASTRGTGKAEDRPRG